MKPEGRQKLQQVRLLATSGHLAEAKSAYNALFNGVFPDANTALEYWRLLERLPGQEEVAYQQLQALEQRYPGNIGVELQIARMAFDRHQPALAVEPLKRLANNNAGRDAAAELWLQQITSQPVSDASVTQLKAYLAVFNEGDAQKKGQEALASQQALLADPAYRARMRGLALVDAGANANAIEALNVALKANPNDAELMGAMGQAQARADNHAAAILWLERAIQVGPESTRVSKWQSLLQTNRYWQAIDQDDKALAQHDIDGAERYYRAAQAQALDATDSYALIGLGDVAMARNNSQSAEQLWQRALQLDSSTAAISPRFAAWRGFIRRSRRRTPCSL